MIFIKDLFAKLRSIRIVDGIVYTKRLYASSILIQETNKGKGQEPITLVEFINRQNQIIETLKRRNDDLNDTLKNYRDQLLTVCKREGIDGFRLEEVKKINGWTNEKWIPFYKSDRKD